MAAAIGIVGHLVWPSLAIDGITLTLLGIGVIPWLAPIFKSVELPGGVKVDFADLEGVKKTAQEVGLLPAPTSLEPPPKVSAIAYVHDPRLALLSLRIEIEQKLRLMAERYGLPSSRRSIGPLMTQLSAAGHLGSAQVALLGDLLPLLNAAAHGAEVDSRAADWAQTVGPQIVSALDTAVGAGFSELVEQYRNADGAGVAEVGEQISRRLVEEPAAFLQAMSASPETFRSWIDHLQHHTFTLFQSRSSTEDELYSAFYERLRAMMIDALAPFSADSRLGSAATQTIEAVRKVQLRTID